MSTCISISRVSALRALSIPVAVLLSLSSTANAQTAENTVTFCQSPSNYPQGIKDLPELTSAKLCEELKTNRIPPKTFDKVLTNQPLFVPPQYWPKSESLVPPKPGGVKLTVQQKLELQAHLLSDSAHLVRTSGVSNSLAADISEGQALFYDRMSRKFESTTKP